MVIRITYGPRGVQGGIWSPEHEVVRRWWLKVQDSKQDVKNGKPSEGTVNIALARPPFRIKGEVADALKSVNVPLGESVRCADNGIARVI